MKISKIFPWCIPLVLVLLIALFYIITQHKYDKDKNNVIIKANIPEFFEMEPSEGLKSALVYYGIKDPEIVYAMAYLETGNFNSRLCKEENNLLGLFDSSKGTFFTFNHWTDCVVAYKNMVEYKRLEDEDMYHFLKRITYAEDPEYINKVKQIVTLNK